MFAAALLISLAFLLRCGRRFPFSDDWDMVVPVLTGRQSLDWPWLWAQHNEHRVVITKLVLGATGRLAGGDLRAPLVVSLALLSSTALLPMLALRRWRGRSVAADALFPLMLLHLGQNTLQWGVNIQFVSSTAMVGVLLWILLAGELSWKRMAAATVAIAVLPLCGANGLVMLPLLIAWLLWVAWAARRTAVGWISLAGVLAAVGSGAAYFIGYHTPPPAAPPAGLVAVVSTTVHAWSSAFGPYASVLWPLFGVVVTAGLAASAWLLVRVARDRPAERVQVLGLLALLGSLATCGLAIGYGRSSRGFPPGLEAHYCALATPLVCVAWAAWTRYGGQAWLAPLGLAAAAFVYLFYLPAVWRDQQPDHQAALVRELAAGESPEVLAAHHISLLYYIDTPDARRAVADGIRALGAAGVSPFARR